MLLRLFAAFPVEHIKKVRSVQHPVFTTRKEQCIKWYLFIYFVWFIHKVIHKSLSFNHLIGLRLDVFWRFLAQFGSCFDPLLIACICLTDPLSWPCVMTLTQHIVAQILGTQKSPIQKARQCLKIRLVCQHRDAEMQAAHDQDLRVVCFVIIDHGAKIP